MLLMMLGKELDADRHRARRRTAPAPRPLRSIRERVGLGLVTVGLRLASPRRGAAAYLSRV